jgi:signal recognition particle subunit SRP54
LGIDTALVPFSVAATQSPIIFIGTGEHVEDLDEFEAEAFVSRLLGWGDMKGMINLIKEAVPNEQKQEELAKRLQEGKFSLRDMYEQFQSMLKMGPLNKVMEMLPGMSQLMAGKGDAGTQKVKAYLTIMDSMTDEELDTPKVLNQSRIARVARGSGRSAREVDELIKQHKQFEALVGKMKGLKGGRGGLSQLNNMVPQQLLKQMGGANALNNMMRQLGGGAGGLPNLGSLGSLFGK